MPVLPFLRNGQCNGMQGDREIVITLFSAEGGMLDEGSICILFANWRFGFFAYAVGLRQAVGCQRPAAAVELVIVSIPMFVLYVRFRRLYKEALIQTASALPSESEGT